MPKKSKLDKSLCLKWNLYINPIDKAEYLLALTKAGKSRCQSAAIRAFMHLYIVDKDVQDKINAIVDDFLVYKEDGATSIL